MPALGCQRNSDFIFLLNSCCAGSSNEGCDFPYTDYVRREQYFYQHICFKGIKEGTKMYVQNLQELYRESTTLAWKPSLTLSIDIKLPI